MIRHVYMKVSKTLPLTLFCNFVLLFTEVYPFYQRTPDLH